MALFWILRRARRHRRGLFTASGILFPVPIQSGLGRGGAGRLFLAPSCSPEHHPGVPLLFLSVAAYPIIEFSRAVLVSGAILPTARVHALDAGVILLSGLVVFRALAPRSAE